MRRKLIFAPIIILTIFGFATQEEDLQSLIGLEINSKSFQIYLNKLKTEPEISKYDDSYYYTFMTKGVEFLFTKSDTISAVFLYSEGSEGHRQFQGKIPYNIQLTDTRRIIEQKLGSPDKNGGGVYSLFYSKWIKEGLTIKYKTKGLEDMMYKIHHITLTKKSDK